MVLTVLYVPSLLDSGMANAFAEIEMAEAFSFAGFCAVNLSHRMYLLISFRKSTLPQNRPLIVYYHSLEYQVDGFVGELTF